MGKKVLEADALEYNILNMPNDNLLALKSNNFDRRAQLINNNLPKIRMATFPKLENEFIANGKQQYAFS